MSWSIWRNTYKFNWQYITSLTYCTIRSSCNIKGYVHPKIKYDSQVMFHNRQNIPGVSQQNGVAAFSRTTEADGDFLLKRKKNNWLLKKVKKKVRACLVQSKSLEALRSQTDLKILCYYNLNLYLNAYMVSVWWMCLNIRTIKSPAKTYVYLNSTVNLFLYLDWTCISKSVPE